MNTNSNSTLPLYPSSVYFKISDTQLSLCSVVPETMVTIGRYLSSFLSTDLGRVRSSFRAFATSHHPILLLLLLICALAHPHPPPPSTDLVRALAHPYCAIEASLGQLSRKRREGNVKD